MQYLTIKCGDKLKAWEKLYEPEVLEEAINLADSVKIISNDGVEIIAEVENHKVKTYIQYNSPSYLSCSCSSRLSCKHEAALVYYLKNHGELYLKNPDFDEVFDLVSQNDLRDFLLNEFKNNHDLKNRFFERFSNSLIDKKFYSDKLDDVFKRGEGKDFKHHGFYDLDMMEDSLYDFIFHDISDILSAGEVDFACDLLIRIAVLLNDEVISTYDSWYDLADRFMEQVNVLMFSIYLDGEKLDALYTNMDHIMNCL